jgi:eukaryotic-like serine/threonine-protein kinase
MSEGPPRRRSRRSPQAKVRVRLRHWTDWLPLASLAIFLIAFGWVAITAFNWLSPAGGSVVVPQFIGLPMDRASAQADSIHVALHVLARKPDYHAAKDIVVGQLPAAGERVREGRSIDVIVSDGVPIVKAPNVSNMSLRDAKLTLENARLELGSVRESNNLDVPEGEVLDQHPEQFAPVTAGTKVDVTVAKGRPLTYTPSFIGLSIDFVKRVAKESHIALGDLRYQPIELGAKVKGTVISQDPPAGVLLLPKEKVALRLSGGAPPTPTPSPTPLPLETIAPEPSPSPSNALPSPLGQRTLRVSVVLPRSTSQQQIRVVLQDSTGSRTLYQQSTAGGITLTFTINVVGAGTIETYAGDTLLSATPL